MENAAEISEVVLEQNALQAFSYRILHPVFGPLNNLLADAPPWMWTFFGVGMFVLAMVWVGFLLKPEYVNGGRPYKNIWTDLRLWTCISMLPHVAVYIYFR